MFLLETGLKINKNKPVTSAKLCAEQTNFLKENKVYKFLELYEDNCDKSMRETKKIVLKAFVIR